MSKKSKRTKQSMSVGFTPQQRQQLLDDGFVALPNLIGKAELERMQAKYDGLLAESPQEHAGTLIVNGLHLHPEFDAAWCQPAVLEGVETVLGPDPRLIGVFSRGLRPGHGQQALHYDWSGPLTSPPYYACHAIIALGEFTNENGATRVIPGSHRNAYLVSPRHDLRKPHPLEVQLTGPAGTVFILNVHCLHSANHNRSPNPRLALFASFARRDSPVFVREPIAELPDEAIQRHPEWVQRLLKGDPTSAM